MKTIIPLLSALIFAFISPAAYAQTPQLQLNVNNTTNFSQAFSSAATHLPNSRVPYGILYDKVVGWAGLSTWSNTDTTNNSHLLQAWWDLENSPP